MSGKKKSRRKLEIEFVAPFSLHQCLYRILETQDKRSATFISSFEEITPDRCIFHLTSAKRSERHRVLFPFHTRPIAQLKGSLQAIDEMSTEISGQLDMHGSIVLIELAVVCPVFVFLVWLVDRTLGQNILVYVSITLIFLWWKIQLYLDYRRLKSLLYEAMSA